MGLLALDQAALEASELLSSQQRTKTASLLNAAILTAQSQPKDPKLPSIIRTVVWAQEQLMDRGVYTPQIKDLRTGNLEDVIEDCAKHISSTQSPTTPANPSSSTSGNSRRQRRGNSGGEPAAFTIRPAEMARQGLGGDMDIVGS